MAESVGGGEGGEEILKSLPRNAVPDRLSHGLNHVYSLVRLTAIVTVHFSLVGALQVDPPPSNTAKQRIKAMLTWLFFLLLLAAMHIITCVHRSRNGLACRPLDMIWELSDD